jgi:superfamily II DNA/RNA helicase
VKKFIIFLDIDGVVCNCYHRAEEFLSDGEHAFWPESIEALNALIQFYSADLAMISSWNSKFHTDELYKEFLTSRGIIVNELYSLNQHDRCESISEFLSQNPEYHYLIIDDEAYQYYEACFLHQVFEYKRICQPNMFRCLDMKDAYRFIKWSLNI